MQLLIRAFTVVIPFFLLYSSVSAQDCSSIDPLMALSECQAMNSPEEYGLDQDCDCVSCESNPNAVGCSGDNGGEIAVPIEDHLWILLARVLLVGVYKLRLDSRLVIK